MGNLKGCLKKAISLLVAMSMCMGFLPFQAGQAKADEAREYTILSTATTGNEDVFAYYPTSGWSRGQQLQEYFTSKPVEEQVNSGTAAADIYYTVRFSGTGIALYGFQAPNHGATVKVFVDGEEAGSFDGYAANRTANDVKLWQTTSLENGVHTLKAVATGGKNAAAGNSHIDVTKAVVTVPVEQIPAEGISFERENYVLRAGETKTLAYTFMPEYAAAPEDMKFLSEDETIVSVDGNGRVTAHRVGTATVTAVSVSAGFLERAVVQVLPKAQDMEAVYVDSGDQYQQKAYRSLLDGERSYEEQVWSWRADKAISEIAVLSKGKALEDVTVSVTDLASEVSAIPASNVKLSFVKEVKAYTGHAGWYAQNHADTMPSGEREYFPEVIYSRDPVDMEKERLQLVWVETDVPEDVLPGIYRGEITVSAANTEETVVLDYAVEVLDAVQPKPDEYLFDVEYWSHPYNVAYYYEVEPFSEEHLALLKQHMELYKELGGHAVTASIVEEAWGGQTYGGGNEIHYPSMVKWIKNADNTWEFDYTDFDKWVTLNKEIGIADKIICYSMMPWNGVVKYQDRATGTMKSMTANSGNTAQYTQVWRPFLEDFVKHLDEKGWFDTTYMGFDERSGMGTAFDLIDSVKNKDGKAMKKSAAFNDFRSNSAIFDRLDYAAVGLQQIRDNLSAYKEQVAKRRGNDQGITMYTATEHVPNSFTKSNPVESYWTILYAGSLNTTGFLRWAYDAWVEDPLEESTHTSFPAGDCFLVYPSEKEEAVKESKWSVRLAKLDEGVRDVNKLYQMREEYPELETKVSELLSGVSGDSIHDYEYSIMPKTDSWGREAKWLTANGKRKMLDDMAAVKQSLYELTKEYIAKKHPGSIQQINVQKPENTEYPLGAILQVSCQVQPASAADAALVWKSSDPEVASVDALGRVTMNQAGNAVITVSSAGNGNICGYMTVSVVVPEEKEPLLQKIEEVSKARQELYTTESWQVFTKALKDAKTILHKADAAPGEVKRALDDLHKAYLDLKKLQQEDEPIPPALEAGKEYWVKAQKYRILSIAPARAAFAGSRSKTVKRLSVPEQVTIHGVKVKVTEIAAKSCKNYKKLKKVTIGANVAAVGKQAFYGCKMLNKVIFKEKKSPKIGKQAFKKTAKKTKVTAAKMSKKQKKILSRRLKSAGIRSSK